MYAIGWPSIFKNSIEENEEIVGIEKHPTQELLCIYTNCRFYIWKQGQNTVFLGKSDHPPINITRVVWQTKDTQLIVLSDVGDLYLFKIVKEDQNLFTYKFK